MTDIDALVARLRDELHLMQRDGLGALIETGRQAADALTTERAKVAALETEAVRWREVAGELAGEVEQAQNIFAHCNVTSGCCMCGSPVDSHSRVDGHSPVDQGEYNVDQWIPRADAALARFKQKSGQ